MILDETKTKTICINSQYLHLKDPPRNNKATVRVTKMKRCRGSSCRAMRTAKGTTKMHFETIRERRTREIWVLWMLMPKNRGQSMKSCKEIITEGEINILYD
jgi:hypothetical protein